MLKLLTHKTFLALIFLFSLVGLMFVSPAASAVPTTTIFIQSDGSINPSNVPIPWNGDVYTFTDNIHDPLSCKSSVTLTAMAIL
jgi:hypothetical protein